ncbi:DNA-directed RNA polymerase subunit omega [Candidatus Atribacteria bacterium 1244-E10-H5-B2]|nr:MAG: DNA-directed RNA polymerase subunit omega [Candidatus Atribacteria bacterium 1244-E10-H5-B2]
MENNKYLLSIMIAKRAKELKTGAKPLVKSKHRKFTMIALEEIKAGKVFIKEKKDPLKAEEIFNGDEKSAKPEDSLNEPEKPEKSDDISDKVKEPEKFEESDDISDKVKEPEKFEESDDISDKVKEPEKSEELSDELEKPAKAEERFDEDKEPGKSEGLLND